MQIIYPSVAPSLTKGSGPLLRLIPSFNFWSGGPSDRRTNRPTWQPGGQVRPLGLLNVKSLVTTRHVVQNMQATLPLIEGEI